MDPNAYLACIGLSDRPPATIAGLVTLQGAHRRAIPFENLDIPLGHGISLNPDAISAKLIAARRGGYCFEHNALFLAALDALGFSARPLLARVWLDAAGVPARTHSFALVTIDGVDWTADAGFGGSDVPPMPLVDGAETIVAGVSHLLRRDADHGWMLVRDGRPQYSFSLERIHPADLALANHWVSTSPTSRFTTRRIASIVVDDGRLVSLVDNRLTADGEATELADAAAYRAALAERFGIALTDEEAARLFRG